MSVERGTNDPRSSTEKATLTRAEIEDLHDAMIEDGCHGFWTDHTSTPTAVERISAARVATACDAALDAVEAEIERRVTETFVRGSDTDHAVRQIGFQSVRAVRRAMSSTSGSQEKP